MPNFKVKALLVIFIITVMSPMPAIPQQLLPPDDCSWVPRAEGPRPAATPASGAPARPANPAGARLSLKTRTVKEGLGYINYNKGKAIDIDQWFKFACGIDSLIPALIPPDKPIAGAENTKVTIKGYLMGMRFMRDGDHDIAVELAGTSDWNSDHMVIEMSAGPDYCPARKALMDIVRKDGCKDDVCILKKPVKIVATGYVLVGNPQPGATDLCHTVSTRGLKKDDQVVHVRGIWRLQPVITVKKG